MASGRFGSHVQQYLRKLVCPREGQHVPDGLLLERYVANRDEAAFAALVQRYGPLVLGVCERVLPDGNDAEDAFQATFLVLVRKAVSLDGRGTLSHWLYTVAYRTAVKLKVSAARRRAHEKQGLDMPATQPVNERSWKDLRPVLDEELNRLPAKYRAPLVLCYLEGKTHVQAARDLGWPTGSVSRRMSRARELLRKRLLKRGVAISTALLLGLITKNAGAASVPAPLAVSTVKAAMAFKAGTGVLTGLISAHVAKLAQDILLTAAAAKVSASSVLLPLLFAVGLIGAGAVVVSSKVPPEIQTNFSRLYTTSTFAERSANALQWQVLNRYETTADAVLGVAMSPDGELVATSGSFPDLTVKLWNVATGQEMQRFVGHAGSVHAVAFSPDGRRLATGSQDRTVKIWNIDTGNEIATLRGHTVGVLAIAFAPDGKVLASTGLDKTIRIWDLDTLQERTYLLGHRLAVTALGFSPDGRTLVSASQDGTIRLWNARSGRETATLKGHGDVVTSVAFSPDGKRLVSGSWDHTVKVWDVSSRALIITLTGHTDRVKCVGFTPDGSMIVSGGQDKKVRLWPLVAGGEPIVLGGHSESINSLATAVGVMRFATGGGDRLVKVWQLGGDGAVFVQRPDDKTPPLARSFLKTD